MLRVLPDKWDLQFAKRLFLGWGRGGGSHIQKPEMIACSIYSCCWKFGYLVLLTWLCQSMHFMFLCLLGSGVTVMWFFGGGGGSSCFIAHHIPWGPNMLRMFYIIVKMSLLFLITYNLCVGSTIENGIRLVTGINFNILDDIGHTLKVHIHCSRAGRLWKKSSALCFHHMYFIVTVLWKTRMSI